MVHGVCRPSGRGLPECVKQAAVVGNRTLESQARGTTKAAVLKGDNDCADLVDFSVYDSKPVHFLSMACRELRWKRIIKNVYDKDKRR